MKKIIEKIKAYLFRRRIRRLLRRFFSDKVIFVISILFQLCAGLLIIYMIFLPFYPKVKYQNIIEEVESADVFQDEEVIREKTVSIVNGLPTIAYDISSNRLIIPKIGVNAPIVEAQNSEWALSLGSWRDPEGSMPDRGGNTVLTGHRFKYLPPSNLTFFLLDKMVQGDIISILWKDKYYYYKVKEVKVIEPTDVSILEQTEKSTITLYTCHPIYSQEQRLVVVAELFKVEDKGE